MEWENLKEDLPGMSSSLWGSSRAFWRVVHPRGWEAGAGWEEDSQVSGHQRLSNTGQIPMTYQRGACSPVFLLILEGSIYHRTRWAWMEKWLVKWWMEGRARGDGSGIFSNSSIFQKRSNSSNFYFTPTHSHQEGSLLWLLLSLQTFPLRGHTNSWYIHFPEINAIMEVFLSLSEVMSSTDGVH